MSTLILIIFVLSIIFLPIVLILSWSKGASRSILPIALIIESIIFTLFTARIISSLSGAPTLFESIDKPSPVSASQLWFLGAVSSILVMVGIAVGVHYKMKAETQLQIPKNGIFIILTILALDILIGISMYLFERYTISKAFDWTYYLN